MRAAPPPVQVALGGAWAQPLAVGLLAGLAAAAFTAWVASHGWLAPAWAVAVTLVSMGLAFVLARAPVASLRWDGAQWQLQVGNPGAPQAGAVQVALDAGSAVLLRFQPADAGRAGWWLLTRAQAGAAWHGLRVALFHRAPPSA